jgi:glutamyl-tRNA reductase
VAQIQRQAERIRQQEVEAVLSRFPAETHADLERLTRSLVRKILHHPSAHLRGQHSQGEGSPRRDLSRLHLVRELFHLDEERDERFKDEKDES